MIDTHCHLTDPRLFSQLELVLSRAFAAGVTRMVTIATHPGDWESALALCKDRPYLRCAVGVHPNYCHQVEIETIAHLRGLQLNPAVGALGEMGLDYHYDLAAKPLQARFFLAQLQLAFEIGRPVIIHCREAVEDCLAMMKSFAGIKAIFHCFTGTVEEARKILDAGHLLGFTGVATYKNAPHLREAAGFAPADRIVVETDAPYLTPEPMRKQKTNEPALVVHTATAVAAARNISLADLDLITTGNAMAFYQSREGWTEGSTPAC